MRLRYGRLRNGPRGRLSAAAVRAGTRLLIHGGWNGDALGDMHALELDVAVTDARAITAVAGAGGTSRGLAARALRHVGTALAALLLSGAVYAVVPRPDGA